MSTDDSLTLERWLAKRPIGDELNELVAPMSILSMCTVTPSEPTKELRHDKHL